MRVSESDAPLKVQPTQSLLNMLSADFFLFRSSLATLWPEDCGWYNISGRNTPLPTAFDGFKLKRSALVPLEEPFTLKFVQPHK